MLRIATAMRNFKWVKACIFMGRNIITHFVPLKPIFSYVQFKHADSVVCFQ